MAKAAFHRNQRVWVESVGAWAVIEKIVPLWAQGFDEPVRISYDVGLGRNFQAHELRAEPEEDLSEVDIGPRWRLLRVHNKWQTPEACHHHPFPGSFPVVVTDAIDWGGWRTPGAEYDRDPHKIELQARLIASAPHLLSIARSIAALAASTSRPSAELKRLAGESAKVEQFLKDAPVPPEGAGLDDDLAKAS
jgi:hypothetical protein